MCHERLFGKESKGKKNDDPKHNNNKQFYSHTGSVVAEQDRKACEWGPKFERSISVGFNALVEANVNDGQIP